jgi:L-threonylcarbamoyladenylate synthase
MAEVGTDIQKASTYLKQGQLVAIPTETVYGLAGNALDVKAVSSIFETKNRPTFDPLILHTASLERVYPLVSSFPEKLKRLAEAFWPGPLTLLLPRKASIPDLVTSGLDRVAMRVPNHPLTLTLLAQLDFPLAAPSANPFGYISPTQAGHVAAQLGAQIPYILDGGACAVGLESLVGPVTVQAHSTSNPSAPGQLVSHYAPRKPFLVGELNELALKLTQEGKTFGVLSFSTHFPTLPSDRQFVLSPSQDLQEAAQRLFMGMRLLDESDADLILAEFVPENGLGRAINDRLKRAAARPTHEG